VKFPYYTEKDLKNMGFKLVGKDVRVSRLAVIRYPSETTIGNHVAIDPFVYISVPIDIGNRVHISPHVCISGGRKGYCKIGDYCGLAAGVILICSSDDYSGKYLLSPMSPEKYTKITYGKIIMENHSQIATGAIISPNVVIGEGSVVGILSLVRKSLKPWGIYYGIPAKRMKERNKKALKLARRLENGELQ